MAGLALALLVVLVLPSAQIELGAKTLQGLIGSYTYYGSGWVPCKADGTLLQQGDMGLNSDGSANLMGTSKTPTSTPTGTYASLSDWWLSAYSPNSQTGSWYYPGLGLQGSAYNYASGQYGYGQYGYYDSVNYGGDRSLPSPTPSDVTGSVTGQITDTLSAYFKWVGPDPVPDHAYFLLTNALSANASASYGQSQATSGLSGTASASLDKYPETAQASVTSGPSASQSVTAYHLLDILPSGGIATVSEAGTLNTTTSNSLAWGTWHDGDGDSYYYNNPGQGDGNGPTSANASAFINSKAQNIPFTIDLQGVTPDPDDDNALKVLTGQQVIATLQGIPSGSTNITYQWSAGGDTFKTYDPTLTSNQLVPLSAVDKTQPSFQFYDKKDETLNVTCIVSFTAPGETTPLSVTVSKQVAVIKPTATWTAQVGYVQRFIDSNHPRLTFWGLYQDTQTSEQFGMDWRDINFTIPAPSPFSLAGMGAFTQLVTPDRSVTSNGQTVPDPHYQNGVQGLDTIANFQSWFLPDTGSGGDSPSLILPSDAETNYASSPYYGKTGDTANCQDSFQTWLMYMPPSKDGLGTVWVPIKTYSWYVNFYIQWNGSRWTYAGYPPAPDQYYAPSLTDTPPTWRLVQSGYNFTP